MPSDERNTLVGLHSNPTPTPTPAPTPTPTPTPAQVGLHWENALLRSEVHACRHSLEQARDMGEMWGRYRGDVGEI